MKKVNVNPTAIFVIFFLVMLGTLFVASQKNVETVGPGSGIEQELKPKKESSSPLFTKLFLIISFLMGPSLFFMGITQKQTWGIHSKPIQKLARLPWVGLIRQDHHGSVFTIHLGIYGLMTLFVLYKIVFQLAV
ncbi:MAG: hypothetical protein AAF203_01005 [Pseudomonadota bacterium]